MENTLGFVIQDAVEILVARAVRLGMFDDHVMIRQLLATREVKPVENAFQAFACKLCADVVARKFCAERERPDVVLMDIHLAGSLTGVEAARRLWQTLQVPIVYCTAHADRETLEAVQTTESYGYVMKPFQTAAVRAAIELALARREKEQR